MKKLILLLLINLLFYPSFSQDLNTVLNNGNFTTNVLRLVGENNIGPSGGGELVLGLFSTKRTNDTRCFVGWKNSSYDMPGLAGSLLLQAASYEPCQIIFATGKGTPLARMTIDGIGNVGINTSAPNLNAKLDVNGNIFSNGKIVIGMTDMNKIGTYSFAVNGSAIFTKAVVKLSSVWPDYVFHPDYHLTPLDSLEQFIKLNKHLPEMPTSADVERDGLDLGITQALLLKKIEELTLIVIEQNKRIKELEKEKEK